REHDQWTFNAFIHDITDRRRAERALREAYEAEQATVARLRELDRERNDFVAGVSHELRTPLTTIIGYLEILTGEEVGPLAPAQLRMLDAVTRNAARLQHLVEDLLAVNTTDTGKLTVEPAEVAVREVVDEAVRLGLAEARSAGHAVDVRVDPGVDRVTADRGLLVRAVGALLSNAVKFSPAGAPVAVHASAGGEAADGRGAGDAGGAGGTEDAGGTGGTVSIAVTDTGAGIAPDELPQVFERFYRTRFAAERAIQGIGLGLSLARTIAQAHGGALTAASTPGEGSTFTLTLPVAGPAPPTAPGPSGDPGAARAVPGGGAPGDREAPPAGPVSA
ncbi:sensor histidine kinase, partial [Planomonospora alba]|uniref:sensor histidine kinase n=1 Tax=Planomonospora alba TaxID=161354 RepID=UPI0031ED726F